MILLLGLAAAFVAGGVALLFLMLRPGASHVHDRLSQLDSSRGVHREQGALTRFVGDQQQRLLNTRFVEAGWYQMTPARFILSSLGGAVAGFALAVVAVLLLHGGLVLQLLIGFVFSFGGFYLSTSRLEAAIKKRKLDVARGLPDFLDIVCSTVEAGIALNGSIAIAADGMKGPLSEELRSMLQDIRLGRSRSEALLAAASRLKEPSFTSTVTTIVQADKIGGDIAHVLEELATDARDRRLSRAEELANGLPNKLVFPMALFMLPSLFVVIFGSIAARLLPH